MIGRMSSIAMLRCKALWLLGAALLLSACAGDPQDRPVADRAQGCPETAIVSGAETITLFDNAGSQDLSDMLLRSTLVEFTGECRYEDEAVTVDLALILAGERGPAISQDQSVSVDYFVAVLDPDNRILGKEVFTTDFAFNDRRTRLLSREELRQVIPLENARSGQFYSVLMGFQLTDEQRLYNQGG